MATRKFSRSTRPRGRKGGNEVRTHPSSPILTPLEQIRTQLELIATAAEQAARDLEAQNADIDMDVAHVLRTAVIAMLRRQVDKMDALLANGRIA